MKKLWDILMGIFMIVASLICQAVVVLIVIGLLCAAIARHFNVQSNWWIWITEIAAALALNALTFYEFRRRKTKHQMLGLGGAFFLLPRGLYRIAYGRETYFEPTDNRQGFPVLPAPRDKQTTGKGTDQHVSENHPN